MAFIKSGKAVVLGKPFKYDVKEPAAAEQAPTKDESPKKPPVAKDKERPQR